MDTTQLKKMRRYRSTFRLMGFMWALVGGMLLAAFIFLALDPTASMVYNGSPTTALGPKVSAAVFSGVFFIVGLGFLFAPARMLDRIFVWHQSALSSLFSWRR